MNKNIKSTLSLLLIAIMAFTSVGLPLFQGSSSNNFQTLEKDFIVQDLSLDASEELVFLLDKDHTQLVVQKAEGKGHFIYLLPAFSLDLVHDLQISKQLALCKKVVVNLTISKLIFPFAYFW